jgi:hypothetical protein
MGQVVVLIKQTGRTQHPRLTICCEVTRNPVQHRPAARNAARIFGHWQPIPRLSRLEDGHVVFPLEAEVLRRSVKGAAATFLDAIVKFDRNCVDPSIQVVVFEDIAFAPSMSPSKSMDLTSKSRMSSTVIIATLAVGLDGCSRISVHCVVAGVAVVHLNLSMPTTGLC